MLRPSVNVRRGESCRHCARVALVDDDASTPEGQRPEAPQPRRPVVRPPLVDDPCLDATLEELDLALGADTPDSYLAPPPLIDRLLVPLPYGRWSQPVQTSETASLLTADPISDANLRDLEEELIDGEVEPDSLATLPPPLSARLPGPTQRSARNTASEWMVGATLILLVFAGAAAGALVFHERLSDIVVHWQTRLQ